MKCQWVGALLFGFITAASAAATMQAVVVTDGKLAVQAVTKPEPASGQVRVKVHAAAVNPADWKYFAKQNGVTPGFDAAGVIDAVGSNVTQWKPGDEVIAMARSGAFAEYVVAPVERIARKPKKLSFQEAAGIPVAGETAYRALTEAVNVRPGQRVLVHGGAGGVGSAAVQIAKALGAHVIATASARNHEFLRSIGADEVIDYNNVKFEEKIKDVDVIVNTVNVDTGVRSIKVTKPGGSIVSVVGPTPAEQCTAAKIRCVVTNRDTGAPVSQMLARVSELADRSKYRVNVDRTFTLAETGQAWAYNQQGHTRGKIIIEVLK